jgi:hypothetical protein
MKNIESYHLVSNSDGRKFEKEINELIKNGWQPHGEMKYSPENENYTKCFHQTMVKYAKV